MERADEPVLTAWMLDHLSLAAFAVPDPATVDALETSVLGILDPLSTSPNSRQLPSGKPCRLFGATSVEWERALH